MIKSEARLATERAWRRKRYADNKDYFKGHARQRAEVTRAYLNELKKAPCSDCGCCFPAVCMDFDHLPQFEKVANIAAMLTVSREVLDVELAKCELVCANCHRLRTHTPERKAVRYG